MKKICSLLVLLIFVSSCQNKPTELIILSAIHGKHESNKNYTYDDLFSFINKYNPDIVGVEIRSEDLDSSTTYLDKNYPFEMFEAITKYKNKKVYGFDWLGKDIEGKPIPADYFQDLKVKKLLKELNTDSTMADKFDKLNELQSQKREITSSASLHELNDGRYETINTQYYDELGKIFDGTKYSAISDFYKERDENITKNIIKIINENIGKKMIFIMGADHRSHSLKRINEELGNKIIMKL